MEAQLMAWLKVEENTPAKPEIKKIAADCGVSNEVAFARWFRLWAYLDRTTADGWVPFLTTKGCDEEAGLPGIGQSLASVGWIEFSKEGAFVMNWDRHNGKSAKSRALHARFMQFKRERKHV
jgi:hypothetical protein